MTRLRPAFGLGLALLLALTSLSLAAARATPRPVDRIVLCTGFGLQTVEIDANGHPVGAPHICPDGLAALAALAPLPPALPLRSLRARPLGRRSHAPAPCGRRPPQPRSRAPPAPIA
ncbi:hypothetical protein DSD19_01230 [Rhodovulum sp. BSW8]|uniref:hypothetical protein n=1 Tax=Rhodovulum sp. BSW8 TaxID=2259645 RepID=UPI000DE23714|nr:hypothetical protein [Rhodovulum sp. BSW8]RBO55092.1 hypothetical protein DSD19_01230 [Rhodovulum sp. BSW8]